MGWLVKVGNAGVIINEEVDNFLKSKGFKQGTMRPKYFGGETYYSDVTHMDAPCWVLHTDDIENKEDLLSIYVSKYEVYLESEYSYMSFRTSQHKTIDVEEPDISDIDKVLDDAMRWL